MNFKEKIIMQIITTRYMGVSRNVKKIKVLQLAAITLTQAKIRP